MQTTFLAVFAVFALLQCMDVASTYLAVQRGVAHEANPAMSFFIRILGLGGGLVLPKLAVLGAVWLYFPQTQAMATILGLVCVIYFVIVANNYRILKG